jgi:dienelactone hydrolase
MTECGDVYYSSEESLGALFDREARRMGFSARTMGEFEAWKVALRAELAGLIGLDRMKALPPEPRLLESVPCEGYRRDKILLCVEEGVSMPIYALVPEGLRPGERRPCVIAPHGHGGGGKLSVAGRVDIPAIRGAVERYNCDYGPKLALAGFVALCPDARAMGERRERAAQGEGDEALLRCSCRELNNMAVGFGRTVTGMWTWDLMRLVDYAESREDCDPSRIGCAGFSSGGQQALWLAAMDERVRCAVVSGYFYGYRDSLFKLPGNCSCNYVPRLWELADMGDLGALVAPRLLLVESGRDDPLNGERGLANVEEQIRITRQAYAVAGRPDSLVHSVIEGGHAWGGSLAAGFLSRMGEHGS